MTTCLFDEYTVELSVNWPDQTLTWSSEYSVHVLVIKYKNISKMQLLILLTVEDKIKYLCDDQIAQSRLD